jgi:hypothetical protein
MSYCLDGEDSLHLLMRYATVTKQRENFTVFTHNDCRTSNKDPWTFLLSIAQKNI